VRKISPPPGFDPRTVYLETSRYTDGPSRPTAVQLGIIIIIIIIIIVEFREKPNGRPRRRCKYNIRVDLQEIGWHYVDWIELAPDTDELRVLVSGK
jgi:hypothetical protein